MCSTNGCGRLARRRRMCGAHYERARRTGKIAIRPADPVTRFWSNVRKTDTCWLWTAARTTPGYGYMRWAGRNQPAHRIAYELLVGPVPADLDLDHECHNLDTTCRGGPTCPHRPCVNPTHLVPRPHRSNLLRGRGIPATLAARTHCEHGHEFTPENTYVWCNARYCRTCRRDAEDRRPLRPHRTIEAACVMCGALFSFVRRVGSAPNVCSETCRAERKRRAARNHQRRKRAAT